MRTVLVHFWKRWSAEYLTSLREYQKLSSHKTVRNPKLNDVVIIKEKMLPRQKWRLGRITELIIGRDSRIRAVKVLVGKTRETLQRPVNLVYPLEGDVEDARETTVVEPERARRRAAIVGDIRCRYQRIT